MALKFRCSNCDEDIITELLKVGGTAKCRSCGAENVVPETAVKYGSDNSNAVPEGKTGSDGEATRKLTSAEKEHLQGVIEEYRKQKYRRQKNKSSLREYIGVSGLIGAGIGLAYAPLSLIAIHTYYEFEGHLWATIMVLPAVPFFVSAHFIGTHSIKYSLPIYMMLYTAVGTGIGGGVYWIRNLIKKKKGRPSVKQ